MLSGYFVKELVKFFNGHIFSLQLNRIKLLRI